MITFNKSQLLEACNTVSKVIAAANNKDAIYNSILFEIIGGNCTVIMANSGNQIEIELPIEEMTTNEDTRFLVPFELFTNTVRLLASESINIESEIKENRHSVQISTIDGKEYNIGCPDPELFIKMKQPNVSSGVSVEFTELIDALATAMPAVIEGDVVSNITGLSLYTKDSKLCAAGASNPFFIRHKIDFNGDDFKGIIITKGLARILTGMAFEGEAILFVDGNKLEILCDGLVIVSVLIDMNLPDVERILNQQYKDYVIVNKSEFLGCMQRIALYSEHDQSRAQFTINDCDIVATASNMDNNAKEEFGIIGGSKVYEMSIAVNIQHVINTLSHINSKGSDIRIYMIEDHTKPIFITDNVERDQQAQTWLLATYKD